MPQIRVMLPHVCSQQDAAQCCSELMNDLSRKWSNNLRNAEVVWEGPEARFGMVLVLPFGEVRISGTLTVTPAEVEMRGSYRLPLLLSAFAGSVEERVKSEIATKWGDHCARCPKHTSC
jgi:hypothetical protein